MPGKGFIHTKLPHHKVKGAPILAHNLMTCVLSPLITAPLAVGTVHLECQRGGRRCSILPAPCLRLTVTADMGVGGWASLGLVLEDRRPHCTPCSPPPEL